MLQIPAKWLEEASPQREISHIEVMLKHNIIATSVKSLAGVLCVRGVVAAQVRWWLARLVSPPPIQPTDTKVRPPTTTRHRICTRHAVATATLQIRHMHANRQNLSPAMSGFDDVTEQ